MNFFQKVGKVVSEVFRVKSEYWMPAGFTQFTTGPISVRQVDLEQQLVDTCASCIEVRAESRSAATVELKGNKAGVVRQFFFKSKSLTTFGEFLNLVSQDADAYGNSFWYFDMMAGGEITRWDPQYVIVNLDHGVIDTIQRDAISPKIPYKYIFHFKRLSVLNRGVVGRAVISQIRDILYSNACFQQFYGRYFDTDCNPSVTITMPVESKLTPEQISAMKDNFRQNDMALNRKQNVKVLWGGATIAHQTGREMEFLQSYQIIFESIQRAFRVPRILLGDVHDVNFSNGLTSYFVFLDLVVEKWQSRLAEELTFFFQSHKLDVQVTITSNIDPARLQGLATNTDPFSSEPAQQQPAAQ